ncbi:MAG: riboflavin synthase [Desulfuromonadaceae bacterium]|nr:riboflavin synthase [Desulfuromonadaceae bacterium]MDD5105259.1 riboflavin synthase [Desulfuromonadaceae bacterium]
MFTGLIEDVGRVASFKRRGEAGLLTVDTSLPTAEITVGDSVAVNGTCLTVTAKNENSVTFDVSPESITRTTIATFCGGARVNLERALKLGDRLGGHIVSGHIDCIGELSRCDARSGNYQLQFNLPADHARYIVAKGSIAIDGISLTVNTVSHHGFAVNIIPHTFSHTTLALLKRGDSVNLETDIIGKYVERLTAPWKSEGGLSMKSLAENGFI